MFFISELTSGAIRLCRLTSSKIMWPTTCRWIKKGSVLLSPSQPCINGPTYPPLFSLCAVSPHPNQPPSSQNQAKKSIQSVEILFRRDRASSKNHKRANKVKMGHSTCPKCSASIAGGSKTCGSCGAVCSLSLPRGLYKFSCPALLLLACSAFDRDDMRDLPNR